MWAEFSIGTEKIEKTTYSEDSLNHESPVQL